MNEVVPDSSDVNALSQPLSGAVAPPCPRVISKAQDLYGDSWNLSYSEDLIPVLQDTDLLEKTLSPLLSVPKPHSFHQRIDLGSVLLSVVVDEERKELTLGSPQFWTERYFLYAAKQSMADEHENLQALRAHVDKFETNKANTPPSQIEQITKNQNLTPLHRPIKELEDSALATSMSALEKGTLELGHTLLKERKRYRSGLMERITQVGFDLAADYPIFRVYMLRFVAMLPFLDFDRKGSEVKRLLRETLRRACRASRKARQNQSMRPLPRSLEWSFYIARGALKITPASWAAGTTRWLVKRFARMLIAGQNIAEAEKTLNRLSASGRDATLDQLGELVVSEPEADTYLERVLVLVQGFADSAQHRTFNKAGIPRPNVSVKMSALCAHFNPDDPEGTYDHVAPRVIKILRAAMEHQVFINMDAEHYIYRDLNFYVLKRVLNETEDLKAFPWVGLAVQAYLRDASTHLDEIIELGKARQTIMPLRLVKGAYWDQETIEAEAHGYDAPQFLNKCETDLHFQQLCLKILEHPGQVQLCVGSHNLRDHAFARAAREELFPEAPMVEHQVLHMTSEPLAVAMAKQGWPVRNYIPVGSLLVGMAYLVRRIMENSSQVGVLTQARRGLDPSKALKRTSQVLKEKVEAGTWVDHEKVHEQPGELPDFKNVAPARLYLPEHRKALDSAIEAREAFLRLKPTDDPCRSGDLSTSSSPSFPEEELGQIKNVRAEDVDALVEGAWQAHVSWSGREASARGACLVRAAELLRLRRMEASVLIALEGGKSRAEALGDVDEAIDFLRFYACEAVRLSAPSEQQEARQSRGVVAVIAPWNFPLAIACGMTSASLVAGNCVLLKPARQTALVGEYLVRLLHEAGVPKDALQALPGSGRTVGAALVHHPKVAGCVFTGSRAVGTWIYESMAHRIAPAIAGANLRLPAKVIAEMGGKNAIIVTANADLDEAVSGALYSSFGHSGQKCSAASRIFVDERVLDVFRTRFSRAAKDLKMGPALSPGVDVNPVIAAHEAQRLIDACIEGREECHQVGGEVLVDRSQEWADRVGHLVGPTIFEIPTSAYKKMSSLARRELFGPVVHLVPFRGLDEAIDLLNDCEYALTGGVFSQSDDDIEEVIEHAECGNIYVNRPITGARVGIEPFGGFLHSGTGPKAGGTQYLEALWPLVPSRGDSKKALELNLDQPAPVTFDDTRALKLTRPDSPAIDPHVSISLARKIRAGINSETRTCFEAKALKNSQALLDYMETSFPGIIRTKQWNRTIPGQESYNRRNQRRGDVLLITGESRITSHAITQVITNLCLQNKVHVSALNPEALSVWQAIERSFKIKALTVDSDPLISASQSPDFATIIYDGFADELEGNLASLLQFKANAGELRRLYSLSETSGEGDWQGLCQSHLRTRALAINTLRHGAPLNIDLESTM